ncbi:MAG: hypothetical protein OEW37_04065 [Rhodospirillaceae bacterium]|nr:hypothetical protein [Rhodospirillaceae bacterium]
MKTQNSSKLKRIETKSLISGLLSIFLAVGVLSIVAISLGFAQMA